MNYTTIWSYLKDMKQSKKYVRMPQVLIDAAAGKDFGSIILSRIEGEILQVLVAGEQGTLFIATFRDIIQYFCPIKDNLIKENISCTDEDLSTDYNEEDEANSSRLLTLDSLVNILKNIQIKGFVAFNDDFFF